LSVATSIPVYSPLESYFFKSYIAMLMLVFDNYSFFLFRCCKAIIIGMSNKLRLCSNKWSQLKIKAQTCWCWIST